MSSETSGIRNQTSGNYPKRNTLHLEHGESLKTRKVQKRLQGRDVTIIQARTIIVGLQVKLGLLKNSLYRRDYKYFSNLKHFSPIVFKLSPCSKCNLYLFG